MNALSLKGLGLLLLALLTSCSDTISSVETQQVANQRNGDNRFENRVFDEVNAYRSSVGKNHVSRHAGLDRMARMHSEYLAKKINAGQIEITSLNHDGFEGRSLAARRAYSISTIGENVAATTQHSPSRVLELWKGSKMHFHTMKDSWVHSGIGSAETAGGVIVVTQIFGVGKTSMHMRDIEENHGNW